MQISSFINIFDCFSSFFNINKKFSPEFRAQSQMPNPGFADIQSTAVLTKNLKATVPPKKIDLKGSAVTGYPEKLSQF